MTLGDQVRAARVEAGLSQTGLGKAANMDQTTISDIENGKRTPGAGVLGRLSEALGTTFEIDEVNEPDSGYSTDEPPKVKKTQGATKTAGPRHAAKIPAGLSLRTQLEFPYKLLGDATANRMPQTSAVLYAQAPMCAAAWDQFLLRYPSLREKLETGMVATDIVMLIMAHLPIVQVARQEAQRLQEQAAWDAGNATPAAA